MNAANICSLALALWTDGQEDAFAARLPEMQDVCETVVAEAELKGVDTYTALSMAWEESKFTPTARSPEGAIGVMQIIPRYWCPGGHAAGCDLTAAGVNAYYVLMVKYKDRSEALCHYNSGNRCNSSSRAYARKVVRRAKSLKRIAETCEYNCGC